MGGTIAANNRTDAAAPCSLSRFPITISPDVCREGRTGEQGNLALPRREESGQDYLRRDPVLADPGALWDRPRGRVGA
jgi:hypothetical protein